MGMDAALAALQRDGHAEMWAGFAGLTVFWLVTYYTVALLVKCGNCFSRSAQEHENSPYWLARNLTDLLMSTIVAGITVPGMFQLHFLGDSNWRSHSTHLGFCYEASDAWGVPAPEPILSWLPLLSWAGMLFTAYAIADMGVCFLHGFATPDYIAHHIAFIGIGLIIRTNCCLAYEGAILMAMEVSTPFLKVAQILRHRDGFPLTKGICGCLFALLFVIFRLGFNSWGVYMLLKQWHLWSRVMPIYQAWLLLLLVLAGAAVQLYWFPAIAKAFLGFLFKGEKKTDKAN